MCVCVRERDERSREGGERARECVCVRDGERERDVKYEKDLRHCEQSESSGSFRMF